ncbi:Eco57I restriction-modification methylase domain-containing protein [Leuconostoc gelidum subsp. gelidum]|uniref:Eco57I restriction-modification methylase domain-containing protein n=1 Tax=Leuconostoc gelidum subsp. gelidum TaxID=1607839 RepID=A0AB35G2I9_LEUGE|nr:Eco57I restriction-modification methylase domain-containing protein [Leuconostoc gelidum]MBZ5964600.1 Eco57I restriction-modification methylase domain-containing protein [Leuconostoc gelidum subsp. gelidum]MBZ5974795.1 Eco57I restriction-modification methylase domain-containing protein [Leuconostoc gelidum subsp. gelidum]MBZ5977635.1 Eco57I restriction-modification methylase domain-containing protein [Leuconostoc gelidum subsp. gelidum]MBZ5986427.1 Eco57I restriction-modification methylase d
MMSIEQYKAFIFSASNGQVGNDKVEKALQRKMISSPIITLSSEGLTQVEPSDILKYIASYSAEKGIIEEANEISVDLSIMDNAIIKKAIEAENTIGGKSGLKFRQNKDGSESTSSEDVHSEDGDREEADNNSNNLSELSSTSEKETDNQKLTKKVQNYYLRILFYAFLSEGADINSLSDVIMSCDHNERIANHLGLQKTVLKELSKSLNNPWARSELDNKISNANALLSDDSVEPREKVFRAIRSFKRISESEVFTPRKIVEMMIDKLLEETDLSDFKTCPKRFIDLTSKSGIYLLLLFERLVARGIDENNVKQCLYAVTTSPIAYEFTRKIFELMGFPIENILDIEWASSYDLIKATERTYVLDGLKQYYFEGDEYMKFDVVVGNPPYNESDKDDATGSAKPLYSLFIDLARSLNPNDISLITPSVWFLGGKGLDNFRQSMLSDVHFKGFENYITAKNVFRNVNLRGGVNYFIWSKKYNNVESGITVNEFQNNKLISSDNRPYAIEGLNLFISDNIGFGIVNRLIKQDIIVVNYKDSDKTLAKYVSERNPFGYSTTFKKFENPKKDGSQYKIYRSGGKIGYVTNSTLKKGQKLVDKIKVITPFANNIGTDLPDDNLNTQVIGKNEIVTETYLVIGGILDLTITTAKSVEKYLKTKFVRYLISLAKANQNGTRQTYRFVPVQKFESDDIDWAKSISEIDQQLYKKYDLEPNEINFIETKVKKMD